MKTTIVRLSVMSLVFTGFAASSVVTRAASVATPGSVRVALVGGNPAPLCSPHDASHCGMD